ncbi:DUF389 domain-containing protein [Crocinitomix catalasitica]|uniref:DUF389 domain-containing protein n=1 Tax=Crocinitomix catalasitica TaxID=184607 RepID=UPI000684C617|nr:DUF389 domain-containing protein [Crocinitomix catalasitica]
MNQNIDNENDADQNTNGQNETNNTNSSGNTDQNEAGQNESNQTNSEGNVNQNEDPTKIHLDTKPSELISGLFNFLKSILSLKHQGYKYKKVIDEAREGVVFAGYNVWILICSIVVASVGLNLNSIPVVIGAMLISPLMGPIRGLGFGVGTNDLPLLFASLKNFGVMVGVSLATSVLYFLVSPIDIATTELLGRTEPSFLDAMIAFFGGLAGVIAFTNGKNDTVISGVAIATALMPPLCTAGFGIANGELTYFLGASYLFLVNSLMIALPTMLLVRYVGFPKREYVSIRIEKRVQAYIIVFLVVVLAPSGYLFYKMTKKSIFEGNVIEFVTKVVEPSQSGMKVITNTKFDFENSVIELICQNKYVDSLEVQRWERQLGQYDLEYAQIEVIQTGDRAYTDMKISEALNQAGRNDNLIDLLKSKEDKMTQMKDELEAIKNDPNLKKDPLEVDFLMNGLKLEYEEVDHIIISRNFVINQNNQIDTTYSASIDFKKGISADTQLKTKKRLSKRLLYELQQKTKTKQDTVLIYSLHKDK